MVPPELRRKRTKVMTAAAPPGTAWCAGCQSYRDEVDFRGEHTQCWACRSAKSHAASIKRTFGMEGEQYDALLQMQGGGCAVCGARPKSKRLAVDHDHATGAVRGLLCSRHNHDALGALCDSLAMVTALWHYLNTPPASGDWLPLNQQQLLIPVERPVRPVDDLDPDLAITTLGGQDIAGTAPPSLAQVGLRVLPVGSEAVPGRPGIWRYFAEPDADAPF